MCGTLKVFIEKELLLLQCFVLIKASSSNIGPSESWKTFPATLLSSLKHFKNGELGVVDEIL